MIRMNAKFQVTRSVQTGLLALLLSLASVSTLAHEAEKGTVTLELRF